MNSIKKSLFFVRLEKQIETPVILDAHSHQLLYYRFYPNFLLSTEALHKKCNNIKTIMNIEYRGLIVMCHLKGKRNSNYLHS